MSVTTLTDRGILDTAYLGSVEEEERVRYRDGIEEGGAYTCEPAYLSRWIRLRGGDGKVGAQSMEFEDSGKSDTEMPSTPSTNRWAHPSIQSSGSLHLYLTP